MRGRILFFTILSLAFFLSLCCPRGANALSCRHGYVSAGATMQEVLSKCGEPADSESWEDARVASAPVYNSRYGFYALMVYVPMDTWIYNFGPNKFIQVLIFERGKLVKIQRGGYGY